MSDSDLDFEAAMRALGVRRTSGAPGRAKKQKGRAKASGRTARAPAPASKATAPRGRPRAVPSSPPTKSTGAKSPSRPKAPPPPTPEPALLPELAALRDRVAQLEKDLANSRDALRAAQDTADRHEAAARSATVQARRLEAVMKAHQAEDTVPVTDHLRALGVLGDSEAADLVAALAEKGRLPGLLAAVAPTEPAAFVQWLDDATVLLGDCGACPDPGSRAVLRVPASRCEVCRGSDIRRDSRKLLDACLASGTTRLTIVGGSPKYHRQLRELTRHHRLKLRLVPGGIRRTRKQARDDIQGSDLVVVWGPTQLNHSTSDLYTQQASLGRVVVIPHRGIGSMLSALTAALQPPAR